MSGIESWWWVILVRIVTLFNTLIISQEFKTCDTLWELILRHHSINIFCSFVWFSTQALRSERECRKLNVGKVLMNFLVHWSISIGFNKQFFLTTSSMRWCHIKREWWRKRGKNITIKRMNVGIVIDGRKKICCP